METTTWPAEWIRSSLSMVVLAIVAAESEPTYGYRIAHCLKEAGMGQIKGGTLYPVLARLEADGFLTSTWGDGEGGPGRKFITITSDGRAELWRRSREWQAFVGTVLDVLPTRPHGSYERKLR